MGRNEYIISVFEKSGISLECHQAEQLSALCDFMQEYNKNVNLTAITDFEEVVIKHFVDSVLPFTFFEIKNNASFIDVGTGAGFPALPLLIYRPDLKAVLCDSLNKRCVYLEKVRDVLNLNYDVIHARGEELALKKREVFDIATARAVSSMPILTEYCLPFVKIGGYFAALKSVNEDITQAEKAVDLLGGDNAVIYDYNLPNGDNRRLVLIKKIRQTPLKYPRNSGTITKKPL